MARPVKLELPGALYHVTSRGDRREDIYRTSFDVPYVTVSRVVKTVTLLKV
jgi:hypothetical protein